MPDENLDAVVEIEDKASQALEGISEALKEVVASAQAASGAAGEAQSAFDETEDEAEALESALDSVRNSAVGASAGLLSASAAAKTTGGSFDRAANKAGGLSEALDALDTDRDAIDQTVHRTVETDTDAIEDSVQQSVDTDTDTDDVDKTVRRTVETEYESLKDRVGRRRSGGEGGDGGGGGGSPIGSVIGAGGGDDDQEGRGVFAGSGGGGGRDDVGGITSTMDRVSRSLRSGLNLDMPDFSEQREELEEMQSVFDGLPSMTLDIDSEEDFDEMAAELQQTVRASDDVNRSLRAIDDDSLIETADSASELRRALSRTDHGTVRTERSLRDLKGASRELFDELVLTSRSVDNFDNRSERMGEQALQTAAQLQSYDGQVRDVAVSASIAANRTDEFGDEVSEAGREATGAAAQVEALDNAMSDIGPNIGDVSTRVAGFQTSLATLARITPMVLSLTTAISGLATAAVGAGGVLGGVFAGGLLAAGQQMGGQLAAANAGTPTEDLEGPAKDAVEAQSELETTMAGVAEIMSRVKEAAFEAMQPLMTNEFAEFSLGALEGMVTLLHELAQFAAEVSPIVFDFASEVSTTWWEEWPAIAEELHRLMEALVPVFTDLVTGTIEALPGLFAAMRTEGEDLLPLLGDFMAALIDILPHLTRLGTAMLTLLVPVVEGLAIGLEWLAPAMEFVADVMMLLGDVFGDAITIGSALLTVIYALNTVWGTMGLVVSGVYAILSGALGILSGAVSYLFGLPATIASVVGKFGVAAQVLRGLLTTIYGIIVGMGTIGTILTGVGILVGIGAILSYFDLWDELIEGILKKWNKIAGVIQSVATIIDSIFGTDFSSMLGDLTVEAEETADKWASYIPGQDSDGGGGGGDGLLGTAIDVGAYGYTALTSDDGGGKDGMRPTPENTDGRSGRGRGRGRGDRGYGSTATNIEQINIDSSPETNDAEIRDAARAAMKEANKEERRRNSSLN